jgi:hypothetical protein
MTKKKPPELLLKTGRKPIYSDEIAARICVMLSDGRTITSICSDSDMPSLDTVYSWLQRFPGFAEAYARAREAQQDTFAGQIIDIADTDDDPQRARNRIDARKWHAAKTAPRKYGDRVMQEITGADGGPIAIAALQVHMRGLNDEELLIMQQLLLKGKTAP